MSTSLRYTRRSASSPWRTLRECARQGRSVAERKAMIGRDHKLSVSRQAGLLGISRGSVYYQPRPVSADDLACVGLMNCIWTSCR